MHCKLVLCTESTCDHQETRGTGHGVRLFLGFAVMEGHFLQLKPLQHWLVTTLGPVLPTQPARSSNVRASNGTEGAKALATRRTMEKRRTRSKYMVRCQCQDLNVARFKYHSLEIPAGLVQFLMKPVRYIRRSSVVSSQSMG